MDSKQRTTETGIRLYPAAAQRPWLQARGAILLALFALLVGMLGSTVRGDASYDRSPAAASERKDQGDSADSTNHTRLATVTGTAMAVPTMP